MSFTMHIAVHIILYADDILLSSTTPPGRLQRLIDVAANTITRHALRFIPAKTNRMIIGKNPFTSYLKRNIEGSTLEVDNNVRYIGAELAGDGGHSRVANTFCTDGLLYRVSQNTSYIDFRGTVRVFIFP